MELTSEQKQRMEQSKAKALARKRQRENAIQNNSSPSQPPRKSAYPRNQPSIDISNAQNMSVNQCQPASRNAHHLEQYRGSSFENSLPHSNSSTQQLQNGYGGLSPQNIIPPSSMYSQHQTGTSQSNAQPPLSMYSQQQRYSQSSSQNNTRPPPSMYSQQQRGGYSQSSSQNNTQPTPDHQRGMYHQSSPQNRNSLTRQSSSPSITSSFCSVSSIAQQSSNPPECFDKDIKSPLTSQVLPKSKSKYFDNSPINKEIVRCDQSSGDEEEEDATRLITPECGVKPAPMIPLSKMSKKNRQRFEVPNQKNPVESNKPSAFDVMMNKHATNKSSQFSSNLMPLMKAAPTIKSPPSELSISSSSSWPAPSSTLKPAFHHHMKAEKEAKLRAFTQNKQEGPVTLSAEQEAVLRLALAGNSIFFTGNAGTGKSTLLRVIISSLKVKLGADSLAVTASTGAAATLISGTTVHSFSGCGLARESAKELAAKVSKNKNSKKRWTDATCLVVDEISMLDADLFDKLNAVAKACRKSAKTFGGLQLILCGDFFQLPPVNKNKVTKFCFEAECWKSAIKHSIVLRTVFRQKNQEFVDCLNECRNATLSQKTCSLLASASKHQLTDPEPTKLCAYNAAADRTNQQRMQSLPGTTTSFLANDKGQDMYVQQLQKNSQAPTTLELKPGAKVILLKNLDLDWGLCNGSRGTVIGFSEVTPPTIDGGADDEESPTLTSEVLPIIEFRRADGATMQRSIGREEFSIELQGKTVATRSQLPLKLAWAISIHKSQGMTIDCLEVDLSGCFECGQAYVALSRATSFEQLRVLNFSPSLVKAHPKVGQFYKTLNSV